MLRRNLVQMSLFAAICGSVFFASLQAITAGERNAAVERLKTDLNYLASDECEGRGPGTKGINLAADYIASVFKDAGLRSPKEDGSYYQPFQIAGPAKVTQPTSLTLTTPEASISPKLSQGFVPFTMGSDGKVKGDIVFVGYGITAPEQNYDDYADVNVEGKIVMMLRRLPHYGNKEKPFGPDQTVIKLAGIQWKLENAEKHKAAAVLLINDNTAIQELDEDNITGLARQTGSGVKIPAIHVKRHLAASLIRAGYSQTLGELEDKINADLKPVSKALPDCSAEMEVTIERHPMDVKNVVGVLPGAGPLANETVIIGAHYDHLGFGGRGSFESGKKAIHHGADDNGSGSTSLLELARRLGAIKDRQGRQILFIAFTGEEMGLLGSAYYCEKPIIPLQSTVAMINLDMVGRLKTDPEQPQSSLEIGGTGTATQFDALVDKLGEKYEFKLRKSKPGSGPSDHASFSMKGLPVLFFFTGLHADYHRPSDTSDKINYDGMARIVDMVEELAKNVATMDPKPEYVKVTEPSTLSVDGQRRRPGPRIGVMPDYNAEGEGMRITGVSNGGPGEKAGLKGGDRIISIAGRPVRDIETYMTAMRRCKGGEPVDVTVVRTKDGKREEVTITVTPEANKE